MVWSMISVSIKSRIEAMSVRKKVLALLLITILGHGLAIGIVWHDPEGLYDTDIYSARAQTIIEGGLLYRDVHTETPPLINYLLVPAQLIGAGEEPWIWAAYQCLFAFLLGVMLYFGTRKWGEWESFLTGIVTVLCPFLIAETSIGEDAALVAFIFFAAAVLMLQESRFSPAIIAVGIWTKMWTALLLPVDLIKSKGIKTKGTALIWVFAITFVVTLPFLLLCPEPFIEFLRFYFLGDPERPSGGRSIWNFMRDGGVGVPAVLELILVLVALMSSYFYGFIKRWHPWKVITLAILSFIVFYPKMHVGYYVMPFVLLSVWAVRDRWVLIRLTLAFFPITLSGNFASDNPDPLIASSEGGWVIGLVLVLIGTVLICDSARVAFKSESYITRNIKKEGYTWP